MRYRYRSDDEFKIGEHSKIPKSWIQSKSQYYFDVFAGGTPSTNEPSYWDGSIPWINSGEVQNGLVKNISRYITDKGLKESSTKLIPADTVLLAMTGATCGNVGYLTFGSTANQSVMAFVPRKKFISKFLYYYLMCQKQQIEYYKTGGAQGGINVDNGKKLYINIPQLKEQEKIVNFLDEKTSQFDLIISKKEKLIERLEEAKKSLISEVVTGKVKVVKSDDRYELVKRSSKEMKDSGVEWIGCIPIDFKTVRLGLVSFVTKLAGFEYTDHMANKLSDIGEVPIVRAGNIKMNRFIDQEKEFIDMETSKKLNRCALYQKCVLMTFIGAGIGEVALFDKNQRHHLAPNVAKIEILGENKKKIDEEYLVYYLMSSSGQEEVNKIKKASAQPSLSMETIRSMKIVIPELSEQYEINKYLSMKIKEIDGVTNKTKLQIEKLKEAKQSLISEAVTGKIEILD